MFFFSFTNKEMKQKMNIYNFLHNLLDKNLFIFLLLYSIIVILKSNNQDMIECRLLNLIKGVLQKIWTQLIRKNIHFQQLKINWTEWGAVSWPGDPCSLLFHDKWSRKLIQSIDFVFYFHFNYEAKGRPWIGLGSTNFNYLEHF